MYFIFLNKTFAFKTSQPKCFNLVNQAYILTKLLVSVVVLISLKKFVGWKKCLHPWSNWSKESDILSGRVLISQRTSELPENSKFSIHKQMGKQSICSQRTSLFVNEAACNPLGQFIEVFLPLFSAGVLELKHRCRNHCLHFILYWDISRVAVGVAALFRKCSASSICVYIWIVATEMGIYKRSGDALFMKKCHCVFVVFVSESVDLVHKFGSEWFRLICSCQFLIYSPMKVKHLSEWWLTVNIIFLTEDFSRLGVYHIRACERSGAVWHQVKSFS